jgi:hypothetical protein
MMLNVWTKMPADERGKILEQAAHYLNNIEKL